MAVRRVKPSPGWMEQAEARLRALERAVLATLDPVQQERYWAGFEEELKDIQGRERTSD